MSSGSACCDLELARRRREAVSEAASSPASPAAAEPSAPPVQEEASAPPAVVPAAAPRRGTTLSAQERREASTYGELYSILVATEHLENAFVRAAVTNEDYEKACTQLLAQFKTLKNGLKDKFPDIRSFAQEHGLHCPLAEERLLGAGVAATALYGGAADTGKESLACFKASENFITLLDAVKLNLKAVDELLPLVRDLQASIVQIPNLPPLSGVDRITTWLVTLNSMKASDHISEDQSRQLALDIEQAYTSLKNWLHEKT
eukprot:s80_g13.t1